MRHRLFAVAFIHLSCIAPQEPIIQSKPITETPNKSSPSNKLQRLKNEIQRNPLKESLVQDLIQILQARSLEEEGKYEEAKIKWVDALKLCSGEFGREAFEGLLKNYRFRMQAKGEIKNIAHLILEQTLGGSGSSYMKEKGLLKAEAIEKELIKTFESETLTTTLDPPHHAGPPTEDKLLLELSEAYCRSPRYNLVEWENWTRTLDPEIQTYWEGLLAACEMHKTQAIETFQKLIPQLSQKTEHIPYAIIASETLVRLQIRSAQREESIANYRTLVDLWTRKDVTPKNFGLPDSEFHLRRIDDFLSSARIQTFVGEYQEANKLVEKALVFIKAYSSQNLPRKVQEKIRILEAEAYQVQANRIAVETKEFAKAAAIARSGLRIKNLPKEWIERFSWTQGLYEFLDSKPEKARKIWEQLLTQNPSQDLRPKIYYWIARTFKGSEKNSKFTYYLERLNKEYPIHIYTLLANYLIGESADKTLSKFLGNPNNLRTKMLQGTDAKVEHLKSNRFLQAAFLRTEILTRADLLDWAKMSAMELKNIIKNETNLSMQTDLSLYLSRFLNSVEDYKSSMLMTSQLINGGGSFWFKYPEQIFMYYPHPHEAIYQRKARENSVEVELLYAISRQESMFNKDAKSFAGAIGLMQLIPATANAMAKRLNPTFELNDTKQLFDVALNIELGSEYLKKLDRYYKGDEIAMITAYNAGEFAVDKWLEHRPYDDRYMWIELIPFQETRQYVTAVLHNYYIYKFLKGGLGTVVLKRSIDYKDRAQLFYQEGRGI